MITNIDIDIDESVVADAMLLTGARTKREVADRALREMVARARRSSIRELFGSGGVDPAHDPKAPWAHADEVGQFRVEQAPPAYAAAAQACASAKKAPVGAPRRKPAVAAAGRKRKRPHNHCRHRLDLQLHTRHRPRAGLATVVCHSSLPLT